MQSAPTGDSGAEPHMVEGGTGSGMETQGGGAWQTAWRRSRRTQGSTPQEASPAPHMAQLVGTQGMQECCDVEQSATPKTGQ